MGIAQKILAGQHTLCAGACAHSMGGTDPKAFELVERVQLGARYHSEQIEKAVSQGLVDHTRGGAFLG